MSGWPPRLFPARPKASPAAGRQLQEQGAILLDVREDPEWRARHAPGARHIPLRQLAARTRDLPPHAALITVCGPRPGCWPARAATSSTGPVLAVAAVMIARRRGRARRRGPFGLESSSGSGEYGRDLGTVRGRPGSQRLALRIIGAAFLCLAGYVAIQNTLVLRSTA